MSETETRDERYARWSDGLLGTGITSSAFVPIVAKALELADDELAADRAENARLRGVVEAVQAVADEWADDCAIAAVVGCGTRLRRVLASVPSTESDPTALGRVVALADEWEQRSVDSAVDCTDDRMTPGEACSALRAALAPVSSSGEAESADNPATRLMQRGLDQMHEDDTSAPVPSGGQADGEGVRLAAMLHRHAEERRAEVRSGRSPVADKLDWIARQVEALAARPVLSREALRERLDGHWPTRFTIPRRIECQCGWTRPAEHDGKVAAQWLDHLADVLDGGRG